MDELARDVGKARKVAAKRAQVLDSAKQGLWDTKAQAASLAARVEAEEADVAARTTAAEAADAEVAASEQKLEDRDGEDPNDDDGAPTQAIDEEVYSRLAATGIPTQTSAWQSTRRAPKRCGCGSTRRTRRMTMTNRRGCAIWQ